MSDPHGPSGGEQAWGGSQPGNRPAHPHPGRQANRPQWGRHQPAPPGVDPRSGAQPGGTPYPGVQPGSARPPVQAPGGTGYPHAGPPGAPGKPGHPPVAPYGRAEHPAHQGFAPYQPAGFDDPVLERKRRGSVRPWVLSGFGVLVVAVVLVLGFVTPGWFHRTVLDAGAVEKGVERILVDSYGIAGVESVACPSGEAVEQGNTFTCRVVVGGRRANVEITVRNSRGSYEVSRPR